MGIQQYQTLTLSGLWDCEWIDSDSIIWQDIGPEKKKKEKDLEGEQWDKEWIERRTTSVKV